LTCCGLVSANSLGIPRPNLPGVVRDHAMAMIGEFKSGMEWMKSTLQRLEEGQTSFREEINSKLDALRSMAASRSMMGQLVSGTTPPSLTCEDGWFNSGLSCYKVLTIEPPLDPSIGNGAYAKAGEACAEMGGHLGVFGSQAEQDMVLGHVKALASIPHSPLITEFLESNLKQVDIALGGSRIGNPVGLEFIWPDDGDAVAFQPKVTRNQGDIGESELDESYKCTRISCMISKVGDFTWDVPKCGLWPMACEKIQHVLCQKQVTYWL